MAVHEFWARRIWSLSGSGLGTTITAAGNSGSWGDTPPASFPSGPLDLGRISDLALFVAVAGSITGSGTPTLVAQIDLYDDQGNLYPQVLKTGNITANGSATPVFAGLHGGAASSYLVLPIWGRVSWTVSGTTPSFPGTEISVFGR